MKLNQFHNALKDHGKSKLRFRLPSGDYVPDHFHITEVGRIDKSFIDCGGTQRKATSCLLQVWTANDVNHRLEASKLNKIIDLALPVLGSSDLPVEVEYGPDIAAQYQLTDVEIESDALVFVLAGKQTDCLAKDKCGVSECKSSGCCC